MSATGRNLIGNERHADDYYATPAWCTRAILPHLRMCSVLDPCCGTGAILDVVRTTWNAYTYGIEIDDSRARRAGYNHAIRCADAICDSTMWPDATIVTNPPYSQAQAFIDRALETTLQWWEGKAINGSRGTFVWRHEVAMLLRLNFLGSQRRALFHRVKPADIFVLPKRPSFTGGGTDATEYAWWVWGPGRGNKWHILDIPEDA